jgi:hypothetical protein
VRSQIRKGILSPLTATEQGKGKFPKKTQEDDDSCNPRHLWKLRLLDDLGEADRLQFVAVDANCSVGISFSSPSHPFPCTFRVVVAVSFSLEPLGYFVPTGLWQARAAPQHLCLARVLRVLEAHSPTAQNLQSLKMKR